MEKDVVMVVADVVDGVWLKDDDMAAVVVALNRTSSVVFNTVITFSVTFDAITQSLIEALPATHMCLMEAYPQTYCVFFVPCVLV